MAEYVSLPLSAFVHSDVRTEDGVTVFPLGAGSLSVPMENGSIAGIPLREDNWISLDVTCLDPRCAVLLWDYSTADGRHAGVKMGILPGIRTRIALPMSVCAGKILFLRRTPGKLKSVTQGVPIDYREAVCFTVRSAASIEDVHLRIEAFRVYEAEPDFPVETKTLVDSMGQKAIADWPGKTRSETEMKQTMLSELEGPFPDRTAAGRSRWGGDLGLRLTEGSGYFALGEHDGRKYLVDPDGYAFFSSGLDCVIIDGDANLEGIRCLAGELDPASPGWSRGPESNTFNWNRHNLWKVFGDEFYDKWCEITARRMTRWGFNTVACWSDIRFARRYDFPHVTIMHGYPRTETCIFRDFPDTLSPEFAKNAEEWAKQIERHADSHALIGYFLSNEPQWAFVGWLNIAAMTLEMEPSTYSRRALIEYMKSRYTDIAALNTEWGSDYASFDDMDRPVKTLHFTDAGKVALNEFSRIMIREYIRIPSQAVRRYDPNHLNLGIRYAWLSSDVLVSGLEYTDVCSFNCYSMDPTAAIDGFVKRVGKPVMIGEFHFGALDRGLDATGIRAVTTQEERGVAYRYYMHKAAVHPMCLGAHYFTLYDQAYLGRFDGENYQIGVVDVAQRPYEDFVRGIVQTNAELYDVRAGRIPPTDRQADRIPEIFF